MSEWKKELITGIAHLYEETDEDGKTRADCGHLSYTKIVELEDHPKGTILCSSCLWIAGEERLERIRAFRK